MGQDQVSHGLRLLTDDLSKRLVQQLVRELPNDAGEFSDGRFCPEPYPHSLLTLKLEMQVASVSKPVCHPKQRCERVHTQVHRGVEHAAFGIDEVTVHSCSLRDAVSQSWLSG